MNIDEVINRKDLQERLDGDFELFVELGKIFIADSNSLISKISDSITGNDASVLGKTAHTLKGSVANFSAFRAFEAALALEKIGKSGDLKNADAAFNALKIEIEMVVKAIEFMMQQPSF